MEEYITHSRDETVAENRIVYERCKRRTLEGRRYGENSA